MVILTVETVGRQGVMGIIPNRMFNLFQMKENPISAEDAEWGCICRRSPHGSIFCKPVNGRDSKHASGGQLTVSGSNDGFVAGAQMLFRSVAMRLIRIGCIFPWGHFRRLAQRRTNRCPETTRSTSPLTNIAPVWSKLSLTYGRYATARSLGFHQRHMNWRQIQTPYNHCAPSSSICRAAKTIYWPE